MVLDEVLEGAESLSFEEKEIFFEIFKHRLVESKRELIYQNYQTALKNYKNGKCKEGGVEDLLKDIKSND